MIHLQSGQSSLYFEFNSTYFVAIWVNFKPSTHNEEIFRLLLKISVYGGHQLKPNYFSESFLSRKLAYT
jgi:hypothetical protein